ncbi:response regulator [Cellulomonas timonensis]|uniref:response regulator n=1 Tax=Cellulomonas timonensis TaxID=1689271 RepID=UPI000836C27B|nr:response regulator [Cellulomonas timonensis]
MIRVVVADESRLVRKTLTALLDTEDDIDTVGEVDTCAGVVDAAAAWRPHLVVLDLDLVDATRTDAGRLAATLHRQDPPVRLLLLTTLGRPTSVLPVLSAKAGSMMLKNSPPRQMIDAIRRTAAGERVLCAELETTAGRLRNSPLNEAETAVLDRMACGCGLADAAAQLGISESEAQRHLLAALRKVGGRDAVEAGRMARANGWV